MLFLPLVLEAQVYRVGDLVENVTLTDRNTGQPVSLHELEGSILVLEWFAFWCPFCQAAAPQVDSGIVDHYAGGTGQGLEVRRVGLNVQSDSTSRNIQGTNAFIAAYGLDPVLQDTTRSFARRFLAFDAQPIFAIINGVADSPSHAQWEILYIETSYGSSSAPIEAMRSAIESVLAPVVEPPTPTEIVESVHSAADATLRLRIEGNRRDEIRVRRSHNLVTWTLLELPVPEDPGAFLAVPSPGNGESVFYQAVRLDE